MRDLRNLTGRAALMASAFDPSLCELVWQGDFGKGVSSGSGVWSDPGANPCLLYPLGSTTAPTAGLGVPQPQFRLGMVITGDCGTEFVFAKLVLAGTTDLIPGQAYQMDKDYNATLLATASSVLNEEVVFLNVFQAAVAAGTYYGWFCRAGHLSVAAVAASIAAGFGETTATAGSLKFTTLGQTAGTKSVTPVSAYVASSGVTFTGNTASGSPTISNITDAARADLQLGQVITGTNLPANAIICALRRSGGAWQADIGTNTTGNLSVLQNATGTASGTTFTVTSHVTANVAWPTMNKQN